MTSRGSLLRALGAAALVLASALPARAESRSEEDATPLGLLRRASAIAVAVGVAPEAAGGAAGLRIEESLRGPHAPGAVLRFAVVPERDDLRIVPGLRVLAFLAGEGGRWEVLGGALGLVPLEEVPAGEPPAVALFREILACHGADGRLEDAPRLRAALVGAVGGGSPRLRGGAALDLLRGAPLLAGTTDAERAVLVRAFADVPSKDRARSHLARVLGLVRPEGAERILAEALLAPEGGLLADAVGAALGSLGGESGVALLAAASADRDPARRRAVAKALGATGLPAARRPLEALAADGEAGVRFEAAFGLGNLAAKESVPVLVRRFRGAEGGPAAEADPRVRRALARALARCDDPAAREALAAAAAAEPDPSLRRRFRDLLASPFREE